LDVNFKCCFSEALRVQLGTAGEYGDEAMEMSKMEDIERRGERTKERKEAA
jgi:cobalamin biosynthesis protein CobD/CbiB